MTQIAINSVTVLGAGTMGAQIALHCANAGIPALLLDLTADVAKQGLERARKLKPDPQYTPDAYRLVTVGGFDTHLDQIATSDWIMEAVIERLDIKQQLLAKVDEKRRPGSIVSSNTSGIPIAAIADGITQRLALFAVTGASTAALTGETDRPESESRLARCKSARKSDAVW